MSQKAQGLCHPQLQGLRQVGKLSALNSTTVKMGLITPVYYLTGKRATANEHLQGALKMKKVPGLMMAVRVTLLSLGDTGFSQEAALLNLLLKQHEEPWRR